jgi:hypothetical protein
VFRERKTAAATFSLESMVGFIFSRAYLVFFMIHEPNQLFLWQENFGPILEHGLIVAERCATFSG